MQGVRRKRNQTYLISCSQINTQQQDRERLKRRSRRLRRQVVGQGYGFLVLTDEQLVSSLLCSWRVAQDQDNERHVLWYWLEDHAGVESG